MRGRQAAGRVLRGARRRRVGARSRRSRVRPSGRAARHRRRQARRHRLDGTRLRDRVSRAARPAARRSPMPSPSTRTSGATRSTRFSPPAAGTAAASSCSCGRPTPGPRTSRTSCCPTARPLWQHVAALVDEWGRDLVGERGLSSVGAVVGATYPRAIGEARRAMPQADPAAARASVPRAPPPPTSPAPSRAVRRARSSTRRAR